MRWEVAARRTPWGVLFCAAALLALGAVGIARDDQFGELDGRYLRLQAMWGAVGLAAGVGVARVPYRRWGRWSYAVLGGVLVLLGVVYLFPPINGAHRWIRWGPIGVQPSELAKPAFVLALAQYLAHRDNLRRLPGLLAPLLFACVPVLLILKQPDLGTAVIFLPVLLGLVFIAGARWRDLAIVLLCGACLLPVLWQQMSREQRSRVTALFEQTGPRERATDDGFHLFQAKRMLSLGGIWGSHVAGDAVDDPGAYRLPAARTDFVYCLIGERLGWLGTGAVLALYLGLVAGMARVAEGTREPLGRILAAGVAMLFAVQVLVNVAMTVGLTPITGLPLPLVSYGGSGLLAHAVALGLVVNVALRPGYEVAHEPFRYRAPRRATARRWVRRRGVLTGKIVTS
jgi:cell division protein FtsW (lipid II flippase)